MKNTFGFSTFCRLAAARTSLLSIIIWFSLGIAGMPSMTLAGDRVVAYLAQSTDRTIVAVASAHLSGPGAGGLSEDLKAAISATRMLCMESEASLLRERFVAAVWPRLKTAIRKPKDVFPREHYVQAMRLLRAALPPTVHAMYEQYEQLKPLPFVDVVGSLVRIGFSGTSVDDAVMSYAKEGDLPLCALISTDDELDFLDQFPEPLAREYLAYTIATIESEEKQDALRQQLTAVVDAYNVGDIERLCELERSFAARNNISNATNHRVFFRNGEIFQRLQERLASSPSLTIAVGALHLCGADGLLERLRQQGFAISRIP